MLALWRFAADDGLCAFPRTIRPVRAPLALPVAWSADEVRKLFAAAGALVGVYSFASSMSRAEWWRLCVSIAWDTGLRRVDLIRLRTDAIDAAGNVSIVQHKTGRPVLRRLSPGTLALLVASLDARPRAKALPWPYTPEHFRAEFRSLAAAAGLRGSFKRLRKSSATNCELHHPGSAATHLGHAPGSRIAEWHYLDPRLLGRDTAAPEPL